MRPRRDPEAEAPDPLQARRRMKLNALPGAPDEAALDAVLTLGRLPHHSLPPRHPGALPRRLAGQEGS